MQASCLNPTNQGEGQRPVGFDVEFAGNISLVPNVHREHVVGTDDVQFGLSARRGLKGEGCQ